MAQTAQLTVEDIKNAITKLSKDQIIEIDKEIHRYIETSIFLQRKLGEYEKLKQEIEILRQENHENLKNQIT